jgi:hypothetical protein
MFSHSQALSYMAETLEESQFKKSLLEKLLRLFNRLGVCRRELIVGDCLVRCS